VLAPDNHGHYIAVNLLRKMGIARGHAQLRLQPAMARSQPREGLFALHPNVYRWLPYGERVVAKSNLRKLPANDRRGRRARFKPQTGGAQGRNKKE
jgi:hypothetical protein